MDAHYKKWVVEEQERMNRLEVMKDEPVNKVKGMTEQTEEEAEAEAMHDEETQKLRDAAEALQSFSEGGSGTASK
jgi:hypothetical protein